MAPDFIPFRGLGLGRVHYRLLLECRAAVQGNCAATCQNDIHAWDTQGGRTHHRRRNSVALPFGNLWEGPNNERQQGTLHRPADRLTISKTRCLLRVNGLLTRRYICRKQSMAINDRRGFYYIVK